MSALGLAIVVAVLGVVPLLLGKRIGAAALVGGCLFLVWWFVFYLACPSLVWPVFGVVGLALLINLVISAGNNAVIASESGRDEGVLLPWVAPALMIIPFMFYGIGGCDVFRAHDYATLIGNVEERNWTQDMQPVDPRHIRQVPIELACWMADKQLGEASGTLGSQYHVANKYMTLQRVRGELWWVAPLDYTGFSVWTSVGSVPGYVMVHAEDPNHPVQLKIGHKFYYTPGAYFGDNLERHIWANGYMWKGLTEYNFEIDEDGNPWWVVVVFEPTISWWGEKTEGIVIVNPETGEINFHPADKIPDWVDRAMPQDFASNYIHQWGVLSGGWVNSWWGLDNLRVPTPFKGKKDAVWIIYGSDGDPYWFTGVTSANEKDQALVGAMCINSRTGKAKYYKASGLNEEAVATAVENKVKYQLQSASTPIPENIYGSLTWVVSLLGQNHTFQGVALVKADTLQVAIGANQYEALREYQRLLEQSGQQIAPTTASQHQEVSGRVLRIASEVRKGETIYYVYLEGRTMLFSGASELSSKLPLTQAGDEVKISFVATTEDVVPMIRFDNLAVAVTKSLLQKDLQKQVQARQATQEQKKQETNLDRQLQNMKPDEMRELLKKQLLEKTKTSGP